MNLIQVDQTCSNLFKLDQIGSKWINVIQNGPNFSKQIKLVQTGPNLIKLDNTMDQIGLNSFSDKKSFLIKIISCCSPQLQLLERRKQRAFNSSLVSCDGAGWQQATVTEQYYMGQLAQACYPNRLHRTSGIGLCRLHEWQPSRLVCAVAAAALWLLLKSIHILQYCYCKNWNVSTEEGDV